MYDLQSRGCRYKSDTDFMRHVTIMAQKSLHSLVSLLLLVCVTHLPIAIADELLDQRVGILEATIANLVKNDIKQAQEIARLRNELEEQCIKNQQQDGRIRELEDDNRRQEETLLHLEQAVTALRQRAGSDTQTIVATNQPSEVNPDNTSRDHYSINAKNRVRHVSPGRIQTRAVDNVAFLARKTMQQRNVGYHRTVEFQDVVLNIGSAYHESTSIFIAPVRGIYLFSVSLMSIYPDHGNLNAEIVNNGQTVVYVYAHETSDSAEQGSVTVVLEVQADSDVWVRIINHDTTDIDAKHYTFFSGVLLQAL